MAPIAWVLRAGILTYRVTFSAFVGRNCRYLPTCSAYALEAIERHGAWRGGYLAIRRIGRCHPWGGSGYDPVPENLTDGVATPAPAAEPDPVNR